MHVLKGIGISEGIAFGKLRAYKKDFFSMHSMKVLVEDTDAEVTKFKNAKDLAINQLDVLYNNALNDIGEDYAMIFSVHKMMLEDIEYLSSIVNIIKDENSNAEYAIWLTSRNFEKKFENMDSEYMQQRASDIRDISRRLIHCMSDNVSTNVVSDKKEIVIGCDDLTPSELLELNKDYIKGFITILGSKSSHTSILAKSMNFPSVISLGDQLKPEYEGCDVIIDSFAGAVYVSPDKATIRRLRRKKEMCNKQQELLSRFKGKDDITLDGQSIELCANVSNIVDIKAVKECDASGIGLFRSEFIYMERQSYPSEEDQFRIYKTVVEKMSPKPVTIRTLDIGADKQVKYFDIPHEPNPSMGFRGIRICLDRPHIFKVQLKAILRASAYGTARILIPMVSNLDEVLRTKALLEECKLELSRDGFKYDDSIHLGVMIETPASVMVSDILAKEVDFFSIGTNDLVQYSLAVDRQNDKINFMFNPQHLAVLRMIRLVCDNAHKEGITVGICGEIASDDKMTEIFLSLGIDELSMSSPFVLGIRRKVRSINVSKIKNEILSKL